MLFNVERDEGSSIVAYVVPDAGGTTPSVVLRSEGKDLLRLEANNDLPHLVAAGRHSTGRCGFIIDEAVLPGLAGYADLEILEASNNVLIYRRKPPVATELNVFRFETHLLPLWRLDDSLRGHFQFWYKGVDRFGRETATQVFCINNGVSVYVSGRLQYKSYEYYLTKGIKTVGIIRDPYNELAERLILLKNIGSRADEILGQRDAMTFAPVIEALGDVETFDDAFCKRFFRRAPLEVSHLLSNPLVRQLTSVTPDEMPNQAAVATALDALAAFEVLGLRSEASSFSHAVAEMVGVDASQIPVVNEYPRIIELGERLRQSPDIERLLEKDLEVFHLITRAFESAHA